jgi:tight adherence protein B
VSAQPWGGPVDDRFRPGHRHGSRLIGWALAAFGAGGKRRRALETAVPEVLDVLRATVAAGSAPGQGLAAAADVAEGPLADVLAEAVAAHGIGTPAGQALADAGRRAGLPELTLAGEALELASRTGAPPARVLAGVAVAAADRVRARQALAAATAEARLSARVIAGLGPAFLVLLAIVAPAEVSFLVTEPVGWLTLALAGAFEAAGLAWSAHIVRGPR